MFRIIVPELRKDSLVFAKGSTWVILLEKLIEGYAENLPVGLKNWP